MSFGGGRRPVRGTWPRQPRAHTSGEFLRTAAGPAVCRRRGREAEPLSLWWVSLTVLVTLRPRPRSQPPCSVALPAARSPHPTCPHDSPVLCDPSPGQPCPQVTILATPGSPHQSPAHLTSGFACRLPLSANEQPRWAGKRAPLTPKGAAHRGSSTGKYGLRHANLEAMS